MKSIAHLLCLLMMLALSRQCLGQQVRNEVVTISDPASVSFKRLFQQADLVAFIRIRAGDADNYKDTLYKADVVVAYKGTREHDTIYFGPFIGYGIGNEYLVFLRKTPTTIDDLTKANLQSAVIPFVGKEPYFSVMYGGYSVMHVEYVCVFDGKNPQEKCDYGIRINVEQVTLPATLRRFPPDRKNSFVPEVRHVRRSAIETELSTLKTDSK